METEDEKNEKKEKEWTKRLAARDTISILYKQTRRL